MPNTDVAVQSDSIQFSLPALVDRAATALSSARTAAEVLEAREMASFAYDAAKRAARLAKAKQAHDDLIGAAYRAQADALEIEASAKRRLADEYDAAQEQGEVQKPGNPNFSSSGNNRDPGKLVGLGPKDIHDARTYRDAEKAQPGVVPKAAGAAIAEGKEPSRTHVRRVVYETAGRQTAAPKRGKDAICTRVREAITALTGLPPAAEVADYFAGTDQAALVDERLSAALDWLNEFADAWGDSDVETD